VALAPEGTHERFSSEGAQEYSPPRKRWVGFQKDKEPRRGERDDLSKDTHHPRTKPFGNPRFPRHTLESAATRIESN